jgi:imidazolonepropionase-like amidohydrolase
MPETANRFTLLTAARLLDGSGAAPVDQAAVLIEAGRVVSLGRAADIPVPAGASVDRKDYGAAHHPPRPRGRPHAPGGAGRRHLGDDIAKEDDDILLLQAAKNARTLLHSGVTTLRENGAKGKVAFSLREGIRRSSPRDRGWSSAGGRSR